MSRTMRDDAIEHDPSPNMAPIAGRGTAVMGDPQYDGPDFRYLTPAQREPFQATINALHRALLDDMTGPAEVIIFPTSPEFAEAIEAAALFDHGRPML